MRIAYHFMIPRPPMPELDGAVQEAMWLRERFGGSIHYLYPARRFRRWIPAGLSGLRQLGQLRALDREVDLHHLFSGAVRSYPAFQRLEKPLVFTLLTGVGEQVRPPSSGFWKRVAAMVVPDPETADLLTREGLAGLRVVPPGIELKRFSYRDPPDGGEFVLLAGSAPWSEKQFETKGYEMLLDALAALPRLRLLLLWRGVLREEMERRIAARSLESRVELFDEAMDVNETLGRAHAAVALACKPSLLKAFPHSLLEALAAGRPIVASAGLAIAKMAERTGTGVVVERHAAGPLVAALERLMSGYSGYLSRVRRLDLSALSRESYLDSYQAIYRSLAGDTAGR